MVFNTIYLPVSDMRVTAATLASRRPFTTELAVEVIEA
jgi:hypothetical protein